MQAGGGGGEGGWPSLVARAPKCECEPAYKGAAKAGQSGTYVRTRRRRAVGAAMRIIEGERCVFLVWMHAAVCRM